MKASFHLVLAVALAALAPGAAVAAGRATNEAPVQKRADGWTLLTASLGAPTPREECGFISDGQRLYLLGGRGIDAVDIFDPRTAAWSHGAPPPIEVHHFQPVVWNGRIFVAGAMTGKYPREQPIDRILVYDPATDAWSWGAAIPAGRRRGSTGAVVHDGKLILIAGILNGHTDGWVAWCDAYDFASGQWSMLPDAPRARDHFEAAVAGGKLYAAGGRRSSAVTKQVFDLTIPEVDVYDFATNAWSTLPPTSNLPTQRAGATTVVIGSELLVIGGESMAQTAAHADVQALDTRTGRWRDGLPLQQGRHGTSAVLLGEALYICAGAGQRGGRPLLGTLETLPVPAARAP